MRFLFAAISILWAAGTNAQDISFVKSTLRIAEPVKEGGPKKDTFNIGLKAEKIPAGAVISVQIQKASESTYTDSLVHVITSRIDTLGAKKTILVSVGTDVWSDTEKYVILSANWVYQGEMKQVKDTLFIENKYPFKAVVSKDYTDWNDGKRAELFIGTNFDFIDSKVKLSDWYGGVRVFLPSITDFRFKNGTSSRVPRFGLYGGLYHAKSLSNFGNPLNNTEFTTTYGRVVGSLNDSSIVRYDTTKAKIGNEINNWGLYVAPIYQWSRFQNNDGKFVTNIYLGLHMEVIRRNISYKYTFDTIGTSFKTFKNDQIPRNVFPMPQSFIQTFYDSYFGVSMPVQFLWKDILDLKINPTLGFGSRGYTSQVSKGGEAIKKAPAFYLVQFDMLARLGGIRLNIGGEVRGYFPNESPIITSYLGTAFSIEKLIDFVSK